MHELSIALSILDVAAEEAERRGGLCVRGIHLRLGPLAGVVKEALLSAFELAREGNTLADAKLIIEDVPLRAHCPACGTVRDVVSVQQLACVECGTATPEIVSGREMDIVALEVL